MNCLGIWGATGGVEDATDVIYIPVNKIPKISIVKLVSILVNIPSLYREVECFEKLRKN